eukprot:881323-Rhodomonas_salina.1
MPSAVLPLSSYAMLLPYAPTPCSYPPTLSCYDVLLRYVPILLLNPPTLSSYSILLQCVPTKCSYCILLLYPPTISYDYPFSMLLLYAPTISCYYKLLHPSATRRAALRVCGYKLGTELKYAATLCCYAMSGTEL